MITTSNFSPISIDEFKKKDSLTQPKNELISLPVNVDPLESIMSKLESIPPPKPGLLADEDTPE